MSNWQKNSNNVVDASGTPGAATIHSTRGRVAIAVGALSVVVTNNLVTATSTVLASLESVNGGLTTLLTVVPGAGTITFTGNANATTAAAKISFVVFN